MSPDRSTADRLNDHLDAVVTGEATSPHDLDPAMAKTVEHFFSSDDAPAPPPGLADHLWQELMDPDAAEEFVPLVPALRQDQNGRTALGPGPAAPPHHHATSPHHGPSALPYLATAALLVLALVGGLLAARGSLLLMSPEQRAIILPATDITTERVRPSDTSMDGILLRSSLDQLPAQGGTQQLALNRLRLAPGAVQSVGTQADTGVGLSLFTVESGQVTVEADAPVLVTRAVANPASSPSRVEPGTAIMLDAGDQLSAPSGVSFRRRNDDPSPAILLEFSIGSVENSLDTASLPPGVTSDAGFPSKPLSTFPAVPAEATVHRRSLAPGAELPVRDVPGLELVYVEAGTLDLVYGKAETLATPEQAFTIPVGSGTESFGPTPEQAVLTNRGAESVVILTASIVPVSAGAPSPEASWSDGWGTGDHVP